EQAAGQQRPSSGRNEPTWRRWSGCRQPWGSSRPCCGLSRWVAGQGLARVTGHPRAAPVAAQVNRDTCLLPTVTWWWGPACNFPLWFWS
uniref:Angiomotin like 2 n=1 Tax=Taeniopygia guttata TaxID=59729 RepID=A0A674HAL3_TAEGU